MIKDRQEKYGGYLKVDELTVKTRKGHDIKREIVRRPNAVAAIVFDTVKKKFIFVKQWRPGVAGSIIEIVAGLIDHAGEDTRQTMIREVEEEVGYAVDNIKMLDEFYSSPGLTTEMVTLYYCEVSDQVSEGGGVEDEDEEIDIIEMTKQEMLMTQFNDAKTIIGVNWVKNK